MCFKKHHFYVQARSKEEAASQENDYFSVAAVRPHGTASAQRSLFAGGGRSYTASTGYMSCSRPGVLLRHGPTGRFDLGCKTMNEFREEELKGESSANVADALVTCGTT
jgi:hypothetical protein